MLGEMSAAKLADMQTAGQMRPPLELCIDAKSVSDSVTAERAATPNDKHLLVHCLKLREFLASGVVSALWWIDTVDMLADGLTKGKVDRAALLTVVETAVWKLVGQAPVRWPSRAAWGFFDSKAVGDSTRVEV